MDTEFDELGFVMGIGETANQSLESLLYGWPTLRQVFDENGSDHEITIKQVAHWRQTQFDLLCDHAGSKAQEVRSAIYDPSPNPRAFISAARFLIEHTKFHQLPNHQAIAAGVQAIRKSTAFQTPKPEPVDLIRIDVAFDANLKGENLALIVKIANKEDLATGSTIPITLQPVQSLLSFLDAELKASPCVINGSWDKTQISRQVTLSQELMESVRQVERRGVTGWLVNMADPLICLEPSDVLVILVEHLLFCLADARTIRKNSMLSTLFEPVAHSSSFAKAVLEVSLVYRNVEPIGLLRDLLRVKLDSKNNGSQVAKKSTVSELVNLTHINVAFDSNQNGENLVLIIKITNKENLAIGSIMPTKPVQSLLNFLDVELKASPCAITESWNTNQRSQKIILSKDLVESIRQIGRRSVTGWLLDMTDQIMSQTTSDVLIILAEHLFFCLADSRTNCKDSQFYSMFNPIVYSPSFAIEVLELSFVYRDLEPIGLLRDLLCAKLNMKSNNQIIHQEMGAVA